MTLLAVICRGLVVAGCAAGLAASAQNLPPTAPTTPSAMMPPVAPAAPSRPVAPQKRARVEYAGRTLEVEADNSSLNGILREIERVTGMKITGGVTEERVYGTYGPGTTGAVLDKLLEGTGANMLLILNSRQQPSELVLTQRNGGPTPPNPNQSGNDARDEDVDTPPQLAHHTPAPGGNPPPPPQPLVPVQAEPVTAAPASAASSAATTTEQSPNGVKTPQQIYEQLMKLQQQKQQTSPQ